MTDEEIVIMMSCEMRKDKIRISFGGVRQCSQAQLSRLHRKIRRSECLKASDYHYCIPGFLFECRYDGSMAKLTRLVPHWEIDIGVITLIWITEC
jgi:hypothetical protein